MNRYLSSVFAVALLGVNPVLYTMTMDDMPLAVAMSTGSDFGPSDQIGTTNSGDMKFDDGVGIGAGEAPASPNKDTKQPDALGSVQEDQHGENVDAGNKQSNVTSSAQEGFVSPLMRNRRSGGRQRISRNVKAAINPNSPAAVLNAVDMLDYETFSNDSNSNSSSPDKSPIEDLAVMTTPNGKRAVFVADLVGAAELMSPAKVPAVVATVGVRSSVIRSNSFPDERLVVSDASTDSDYRTPIATPGLGRSHSDTSAGNKAVAPAVQAVVAAAERLVKREMDHQAANKRTESGASDRSPFAHSESSESTSDTITNGKTSPKSRSRSGSGSSAEELTLRPTGVPNGTSRPATAPADNKKTSSFESLRAQPDSAIDFRDFMSKSTGKTAGAESPKLTRRNSSGHPSSDDSADESGDSNTKRTVEKALNVTGTNNAALNMIELEEVPATPAPSLHMQSQNLLRQISANHNLLLTETELSEAENVAAGQRLLLSGGKAKTASGVSGDKASMDSGSSANKSKSNSFFTKKFTFAALFGAGLGIVGYIAYRIFAEANENDDDEAEQALS